ncbi:alpha/beta hydrolase family protein [Ornithinibacillus californiensis]|uniref:alpha/beta hydrolase family protein n=1 Tax=Ornithinibacillus californiensis TaxID=161536 RepID=UPI00064D9888|nr:prolyl oligopeptidase family serine peptidase [Ornithinibacillus californiensis]
MAYDLQDLHKYGIPPLREGISTRRQWEEKRTRIYDQWIDYIGDISSHEKIAYTVVSVEKKSDHYRIKLTYTSPISDKVPAYILLPIVEGLLDTNFEGNTFDFSKLAHLEKLPAVLALHPTTPLGKDDISLSSGKENRKYALELVRRGYVVLAPDTITAGERVETEEQSYLTRPFYEEYPNWSAVAKMIVDHRQGIELLRHIGIVDLDRIGVIGHSLGGYNGYFLAGVDKRIKAVVCSCGLTTFSGDAETHRWGKRDWFTHIPKISDSIEKGEVSFEFNEIAALVAPTPFFVSVGLDDHIFPHWEPTVKAVEDLHQLYKWLDNQGKFVSYIGNFGHDFPKEMRYLAYDFLDQWLLK